MKNPIICHNYIAIIYYLIIALNEEFNSTLHVVHADSNIQNTSHLQYSSLLLPAVAECSATCPVDYIYVSASGGTCQKCAAGSQCPCEGTRCTSCPGGKFNTAGSGLGCQNCPSGQYTASFNSGACNICPVGTYSFSGKLYCSNCPKGQYQSLVGQRYQISIIISIVIINILNLSASNY
jgi:hypothetical protein